jgi:hypothetical protein
MTHLSPILIAATFLLSAFSQARADSASMNEAVSAEGRAYDSYYRALKKSGNTPQNVQKYRSEIIDPARDESFKSMAELDRNQQTSVEKEEYTRSQQEFVRDLQEIKSKNGGKLPPEINENPPSIMSLLKRKPAADAKVTDTSNRVNYPLLPNLDSEIKVEEGLDGSGIPREIEFPGPKK